MKDQDSGTKVGEAPWRQDILGHVYFSTGSFDRRFIVIYTSTKKLSVSKS